MQSKRKGGRPAILVLGLGGLLGVIAACEHRVILADGPGSSAEAGGAGGSLGGASGGEGSGGEGGAGSPARPTFGAPRLIEELSVADAKDQDPTLTGDLLEIIFFSERTGEAELWAARRDSIDAPWDPPTQIVELSSPEMEINPALSRDGLRLWFHSQRDPSGIYFTERATRSDPWSTPTHIDTFAGNIAPAPSSDELRMAYSIYVGDEDHRDLVESVRPTNSAPWEPSLPIDGINGPSDDSTPFFADEGLTLFFCSSRTGAGDLYFTKRPDFESPVETPLALTELNQADTLETHPHVSVDGRRIFFGSGRTGVADIYEAELVE